MTGSTAATGRPGSAAGPVRGIDPRGARFAAGISALVLAVTVLTGSPWLLLAQGLVFLVGTVAGPPATPYGWFFRRVIRPRLGPPPELEDPRPPTFAQGVGLVVVVLGLVVAAFGVDYAVVVAAALAFVAAFLNAAFGLCLGCEAYLLLVRMRAGTAPRAT